MAFVFEILNLEIPCAKILNCFRIKSERSIKAKKILSNIFSGLYPKQKLLRYVFSTSCNKTDDIPTSSGVSEDVVKNTSPFLTQFCFSSTSISSRAETSTKVLLNILI